MICVSCQDPIIGSDFYEKDPSRHKTCREYFNVLKQLETGNRPQKLTFCVLRGNKKCNICTKVFALEDFPPSSKNCKYCDPEFRRNQYKRRCEKVEKGIVKIEIPKESVCIQCGETKESGFFYKNKIYTNGLSRKCIDCDNEKKREYHYKNKEKCNKVSKEYYKNNKEKSYLYQKQWNADNIDKRRASAIRYNKKKKSSLHGYLEVTVLSEIRKSVKKASKSDAPRKWEKILGYSFIELKTYLESLFTEGMTWEYVLNGTIHIDHIVPRSFFYYESIEDKDFYECWKKENLSPKWEWDNRSKGDIMPDGSLAREHKKEKIRLLAEEYSVAGYGKQRHNDDDIFG